MLKRIARRLSARRVRQAEAAHEALHLPEEREAWEAVLRTRADHPRALRRAAELAALCGDAGRARELWERARDVPDLALRAHGELARRTFEAGETEQARAHADRFLAESEPEPRAFSLRRQVESLRAHLECDPERSDVRHVCVTGVAFSGSTLLANLLGGQPGLSNIGESHWLIHRRVERESYDIDFDADREAAVFHCNGCGPTCPLWTWEARRALSEDRRDWFHRIGLALGTPVLVSSDKNQLKHLTQDPWLRFDALVLFRHPRHAWHSAVRPGRKWREVVPYLKRWEEHYRRLAFDLPNRGRKLFLDLDRFREDPDRHLARLASLLAFPDAGAAGASQADHSIGGNAPVVAAFQREGEPAVVSQESAELTDEEEALTERFARESELYAHLGARHAEAFGP